MTRLLRRLGYWLRQGRMEAEIAEEMEFHRAARQAELEAGGVPPTAAAEAARREMGNTLLAREDARAVWIWPAVGTVWQDARHAARMLRRQPSFSLVVMLTLALGIGVNAAVFGLADALLLRPFQFPDHERIVVLREMTRGSSGREPVAPAIFDDWRSEARSFDALAAWEDWGANLISRDETERLQGARVSSGFFEVVGVDPARGRPFAVEEMRPGNDRRVIVSDGLWHRRFGGNPNVVGTTISIDGEPYAIIGIAPPRFAFPVGADIWAPLVVPPDRAADRNARSLTVIGRLAGAASLERARAEMDVIGERLAREHPDSNRNRAVAVEPLATAFREGVTAAFVGILQAGAGLVLLIACANLVALLLARALDRRRELAMRTALGAGRMRLVRQLVTETVLLGLLSSVLALMFARASLDLMRSSMPAEVARHIEGWQNLQMDARLLVIVPAFAIGVGLLVGLVPAISASRASLADAIKNGDRGMAGSHGRPRGRQALVVAEIALALAALVVAGLTVAGGARLVTQHGGFDSERLMTLELAVPDRQYPDPADRRALAASMIDRLAATPGVERAALSSILPAAGWSPSMALHVEHQPVTDASAVPQAGYQAVSDAYFDTLRIPLVRGGAFSTQDREDSQPVAIVSAALAERFWPGTDALGRRIRLGDSNEWLTVVGIAGDVTMYNWWDGIDFSRVYVPLRQAAPGGVLYAAARTHRGAGALAGSLRAALRSVDPNLPVQRVRTMERAIEESSVGVDFLAVLLTICGVIAGVLAMVGIYGMMAYAVSQRSREFGIRIALGGTARDILALTMRQAGMLTAAGLAAGCVLAAVFGSLMASALYGLVSIDALTFLLVGAALGAASLAAAYLPARRTLRLDAATILRA